MAIAAEKRVIAIIDQRIAVISRNIRREQNARRDVQRMKLEVIARRLAKRTAKGARLEELVTGWSRKSTASKKRRGYCSRRVAI